MKKYADPLIATGLTLLAFVHRLAFLHSNRDREWPFTVFYEGDSETFFRFARAILGGEIYDAGIPFHPPGFAYFLAGVHQLLGFGADATQISHLAVKTVLAFVGALAVGLVYLLVRPYLGRPAALVSAGLCLYHFGLYVISIATVSEGLSLTLLLLALLLWSRALEHPLAAPGSKPAGWRGLVAGASLGLLLGGLALVRAEMLLTAVTLVGVGVAGWAWRRRQDGAPARQLLPWVLVVLGFIVALTPWTLHNARQLEAANERLAGGLAEPLPTFVPLTLYGPLNLALANHDGADGTFSPDLLASLGRSGQLQLADPEHLDLLLHGERRALAWILENPGAWAALVVRKWSIYFRALSFGFTQWDAPAGLAGTRRPVDVMTPHSTLVLWLAVPLVLLGAVLCWRLPGPPRRWLILVALLTALGLVTSAFFFGYARQGLLLLPLWMSLAAAAVVTGITSLLRRKLELNRLPEAFSRGSLIALAVIAALLLALELHGARADRNYKASGTTLPGSQKLNRDLPIELEPIVVPKGPTR